MAEPIKTTIQEAFDHIKSWIAEGNKEKAIQGLNEILNFDPTNSEAQKLLLEVKTGSTPIAVTPSANPTPAPMPTPMPTPAPAPMPVMASAPMPPPMPAINEAPMQAPSVMPPKAVPMASVTSAAAVSQAPMVAMLMGNMKLIIAVGGVIVAIVAGYIFYKGVLSSADVISSDIKSVQDAQTQVLETTTPAADTTTTPDVTTTPDATTPATSTDGTVVPGLTPTTPDTTAITPTPTDTTPVVSDPNVVEATTGKVKRK